MQNVAFEVEGDQLIIRVDLSQELGVSSSGKSVIIATTGGNVAVPGWEAVKVGLMSIVRSRLALPVAAWQTSDRRGNT